MSETSTTTSTPASAAPVERAPSADGTPIAYEAYGSGPVVAVVGGAFCDRGSFRDLARTLAEHGFTGVTYDRRGRGGSGDVQPYAVAREVDDLRAVIDATRESGSPAYAFGVSSGGALVLRTLAAGGVLDGGATLEVPFRTPAAPPPPVDYIATLERFEAKGDREGILRYFHEVVVGMPPQLLDAMKGTPAWEPLLALTYTVKYDGHVLGGDEHDLPHDLLRRVHSPVLALCSSGTAVPWIHDSAQVLADALPLGTAVELEGGFHEVPPQTLAPVLAKFFRSASR